MVQSTAREGQTVLDLGLAGKGAEEFADLVACFASARAGDITGTAINFGGGMSAAV
jgi:hypothetical protein